MTSDHVLEELFSRLQPGCEAFICSNLLRFIVEQLLRLFVVGFASDVRIERLRTIVLRCELNDWGQSFYGANQTIDDNRFTMRIKRLTTIVLRSESNDWG